MSQRPDSADAIDLRAACARLNAELTQWFSRLADPTGVFDESDGVDVDRLLADAIDLEGRHGDASPQSGSRLAESRLADLYESPIPSSDSSLAAALADLLQRCTALREIVWARIEAPAIASTNQFLPERLRGEIVSFDPGNALAPSTAGRNGSEGRRRAPSADPWRIPIEILTGVGALIVLFVLYALFGTGLSAARDQRDLSRSFDHRLRVAASEADQAIEGEQESGVLGPSSASDDTENGGDADEEPVGLTPTAQGDPVAMLSLPTIGVRQIAVEGTHAEQLANGPGHLRSTPLPGRAGNSVFFGRRTTFGGPFRDLDDLRPGDPIDVATTEGLFRYVVQEVIRVGAGEPDPIGATFTNRLTLMTSDALFSTGGRLVAIGRLQGTPVATPTTPDGRHLPLPPVTPDELGTERTSTDWALMLLWTQVLLLVYFGSRWLYRHWLPWSTWLISTPVMILLAFSWFDSVSRLLPSTL